jgi:predicted nicotinamide N-methyase
VSLREDRNVISGGTTGLCCWPAGEALATWLDSQPEDRWRILERCSHADGRWAGGKVMELGSGAGLTGIFLVKRWRHRLQEVVLTDCHPEVLGNLGHNLTANLDPELAVTSQEPLVLQAGRFTVRTLHLDWEQVRLGKTSKLNLLSNLIFQAALSASPPFSPDVVLGADIVFDVTVIPSLVSTLRLLLPPSGRAFLACTVRNRNTVDFFLEQCAGGGLAVEEALLAAPGPGLPPIVLLTIQPSLPRPDP